MLDKIKLIKYSKNMCRKKYTSNYKKFRKKLLKEVHDSICVYCEKSLSKEDITLDHKTPLSKGGELKSKENIVISCQQCNSLKGDLTYEKFMAVKDKIFAKIKAKEEALRQPIKSYCKAQEIVPEDIKEMEHPNEECEETLLVFSPRKKVYLHHSKKNSEEKKLAGRVLAAKLLEKAKCHAIEKLIFILNIDSGEIFVRNKSQKYLVDQF